MKKHWVAPQRNWDNIQFEKLRRIVDPKFNEAHDVLSKAYYEGTEFVWRGKNWGILDKEIFDKLHGLIFHLRTVEFHKQNLIQSVRDRISEDEYNNIRDRKGKIIDKETVKSATHIKKLKDEGIELEV